MYKGKKLRMLAAAIAFCVASGTVVSAPAQYIYAAETITMSETEKNIVAGDTFQLKVSGAEKGNLYMVIPESGRCNG